MRSDRMPDESGKKPHSLIRSIRGVNKYVSGEHVCKCGKTFTGINAYELHRADARRTEKASV